VSQPAQPFQLNRGRQAHFFFPDTVDDPRVVMPQPPLLLDMLQASLQKIGVRLEHADPGDAMPLRIARGAV
jgi:hypothetical protein